MKKDIKKIPKGEFNFLVSKYERMGMTKENAKKFVEGNIIEINRIKEHEKMKKKFSKSRVHARKSSNYPNIAEALKGYY